MKIDIHSVNKPLEWQIEMVKALSHSYQELTAGNLGRKLCFEVHESQTGTCCWEAIQTMDKFNII